MATDEQDVAKLQEALRICRAELAGLREAQETWAERTAPLEDARRRLEALSTALAEHFADTERTTSGLRGWVRRRLLPNSHTEAEAADLERIRTSPLFDAAWYLREYPDVARSGMSPALHFLRRGAAERKNPGPHFDVRAYFEKHPELPRRTNALLHYQASVPGVPQ